MQEKHVLASMYTSNGSYIGLCLCVLDLLDKHAVLEISFYLVTEHSNTPTELALNINLMHFFVHLFHKYIILQEILFWGVFVSVCRFLCRVIEIVQYI